MVALRTLERTAVFAWSPGPGSPLLATGTKQGALSDDFSSEIKLELWNLELDKGEQDAQAKPIGSVTTDSGFNDIAWSEPSEEHPLGVIAGALDNGSVDLWDGKKLRDGEGEGAFISRTTKHSGPVKALQWNPYRHNLLASVGAKGEIFIYDFHNMSSPFRLGASAARADDLECLDWNKSEKTAHILATGSSGGFVTVWDVKQKKDILTLHNQGRKAVSAVAWDPEQSTKLATATNNDQEPLIFIWSLRNAAAPEQTLKGHELGVLGLSWCVQDPDLLLSCGKDNRTICWNSRTGEQFGSFAAGSNWAFQTRWNPHNPTLIASASFDGKILITSTQSTNSKAEESQNQKDQALDGEDFFAKAQSQPQGISFSLRKAPKFLARPCSATFGFGGKIVTLISDSASRRSKVNLQSFIVDSSIGEAAREFEEKLKQGDVASICAGKIEDARTEEERADWRVIETLNQGKSRKKLREYLGFEDDSATENELASKTEKLDLNGEKVSKPQTNGDAAAADDDDFFANTNNANITNNEIKTNNTPFSLSFSSTTGTDESDADHSITRALMLGQFEKALDVCLQQDPPRLEDGFMIAICGGQKCIDKAQNAYFASKSKSVSPHGGGGAGWLRLLASVVNKNLHDLVKNAKLEDWKSVMASLCTYADETEFAELCEVLGDRLELAYQEGDGKDKELRRDASFCYLAGTKLEKVVTNWIQELSEQEKAVLLTADDDGQNDFSVHAKCLQEFIEKVSVFRRVTGFQDSQLQLQGTQNWKLAPLYQLYTEYADILAAHGQLASAEQYVTLLPGKYGNAESAQQRVRQATRKPAQVGATQQRQANASVGGAAAAATPLRAGARVPSVAQAGAIPAVQPLANQARNAAPSPYAPSNAPTSGMYAPSTNTYPPTAGGIAGYQPPQQSGIPYAPPQAGLQVGGGGYGGYQPPQQQSMGYQPPQQQMTIPAPPPPRASGTSSPAIPPPSAAKNMSNWNDMPDNFFKDKPNSRRGTPGPQAVTAPFPGATQPQVGSQQVGSPPPAVGPPLAGQGVASPLPPPPKAGEALPRMTSPPTVAPPMQQTQSNSRPGSSAANAYAPPQQYNTGSTLPPAPATVPINRGASPYQPPPSTSTAAPSSRYAPAPGSLPSPGPGSMPPPRQVAPNPYTTQQSQQSPYAPQQQQQTPYTQPAAPPMTGPPPQGPPRSQAAAPPPPQGPPRNAAAAPPPLQSQTQQVPSGPPQSQARPPSSSAQQQSTKPTYPRGDRSHIPPSAQPIYDILTPEIARIKSVAPQQYKPQVDDMEKRLNILFDHLNNQDLLSEETVGEVRGVCEAVGAREWDRALGLFTQLQTAKLETEGGNWMVGLKRLINMGKISKI